MAASLEIIERDTLEFKNVQKAMVSAKKENATETYAILKERYASLKAILTVAGVNMSDIDIIKE